MVLHRPVETARLLSKFVLARRGAGDLALTLDEGVDEDTTKAFLVELQKLALQASALTAL
jgi:hypothetical protein